MLHWSKGSHAEATDFQPLAKELVTGLPITLESFGGRSSDGVLPYFNLARHDGGMIIAVGSSGDWKASFELQSPNRVKITAGLQQSRFRLQVGEELRLPSVLVMTYQGTWLDGQNQFHRLMLRHFTPQNDRPMDLMPVAASVHGMLGFNDTTEENLRELASEIAAWKLPLDTFWLDAGWNQGGFPRGQGNLNADPMRFPKGLAPVGRQVHQTGMRFLAWFEPERAMVGSWLDREHSDWLLSPSGTPPELRYLETDGFRLLDFGNSSARQWALETVSQHLRAANISVYRQDFNAYFFPLTDGSLDSKKWLAFQFHDPATGAGIIQAFCGADGSERSLQLKPMGLDANKRYAIADWDHLATPKQWSGSELIETGIEVRSRDVDQAIVLHYIPKP